MHRTKRLADLQFQGGQDIFASQWTDIHKMAQTGDIRGLRFFLEDLRTPPDEEDDKGDTPLNRAAYAGQSAAAEELLRHGANTNARNNKGWTPAMSAASANRSDLMVQLYRAGADLSIRDTTGSTVAHIAASRNSEPLLLAIYECLGEPGAFSSQANSGATPAHVAAVFDNVEALKMLYELGVDVDTKDNAGETPAHKAARSHHVTSLEFLQAVGADMNTPNYEDDTPRHLALWGEGSSDDCRKHTPSQGPYLRHVITTADGVNSSTNGMTLPWKKAHEGERRINNTTARGGGKIARQPRVLLASSIAPNGQADKLVQP